MSWCDPCAADPLTHAELRKLGVFWLTESGAGNAGPQPFRAGGPVDVFMTRLHVRYDAASFPEDLVFQETADRDNFQGRYILQHPWKGETRCEAAERYREALRLRAERQAGNLAALTGWPIEDIRRKIGSVSAGEGKPDARKWWQKLYGEE
jgi:hypothetical protein